MWRSGVSEMVPRQLQTESLVLRSDFLTHRKHCQPPTQTAVAEEVARGGLPRAARPNPAAFCRAEPAGSGGFPTRTSRPAVPQALLPPSPPSHRPKTFLERASEAQQQPRPLPPSRAQDPPAGPSPASSPASPLRGRAMPSRAASRAPGAGPCSRSELGGTAPRWQPAAAPDAPPAGRGGDSQPRTPPSTRCEIQVSSRMSEDMAKRPNSSEVTGSWSTRGRSVPAS